MNGSEFLLLSRRFRATQIQGLELWLDSADPSSIAIDGSSNVSQWSDKSGKFRHATQGSAGSRPSYIANTVNGLPAITFDGVNDVLNGSASLIASSGDYTMFGVAKKLTNTTLGYFYVGPSALTVGVAGASDKAGFLTNAVGWTAESSSLAANSVICQSLRRQSGTFAYRRGSNALSSSSLPTVYGANYLIGTHAGGFFQNNIVCEVMFYSRALTDSEMYQARAYLTAKWGLP